MPDSSSHAAQVAEKSDGNRDLSSTSTTLLDNITTKSDSFYSSDDAAIAAEEIEIQRQIEELGSVYLEDGDDVVSQLLLAAQSGDTEKILSILKKGVDVDATRMVSYLCREEW